MHQLLSHLSDLPLYQQLNLGMLGFSFMLCLAMVAIGWLVEKLRPKDSMLPPVPLRPGCSFPSVWDTAFLFFFLGTQVVNATSDAFISDALPEDPEVLKTISFGADSMLWNALIYFPLLLRYAFLPAQPQRMGLGASFIWALGAVFCVLFLSLAYEQSSLFEQVCKATGSPKFQTVVELIKHGNLTTKICLVITAVCIAPVVEECCYRGFLYNILKRRCGWIGAMVGSSLLFGAVHMSLPQMLPLCVFAALLCLLYEKTQSLRTTIIAHAIFNGLSTLGIFLLPSP